MEPNDNSEEITSIKNDEWLNYIYNVEKDDQETWKLLQEALHMDVQNHEDKYDHKYNLPQPREFHSFSKNIYVNYENLGAQIIATESAWRLLYQVQGKVIYNLFDGFFAELYFNTDNHYLLLVIKGTSSFGNLWSDLKNVGLGLKGGELDSAFTFGEKVRVLMNKFKCKPMLLITGHSLGGYLAQIITYTITYCYVDGNGKVKSRKDPMEDFGIYTVVFDSPAALKQISSIDPRDPVQLERFRLPIVNFVVDVNIFNSNSLIGRHLGQVISVKEFEDLNVPSKWKRICKTKSVHGIKNFEDIEHTEFQQVEIMSRKKTIKCEEKEIHLCIFSYKNFERLNKYLFFSILCAELVNKLPNFKIFNSCILLEDESVSAEEFIPKAHFFLSQFMEKLDNGTIDAMNTFHNTIYEIWKAEMLKHAHNFCLNEQWKGRMQELKDGTKIGGFKSFEEMRFAGCLIHNSFERCIYYDYDQFIAMDHKILEYLCSITEAMLILIVKRKNQSFIHRGGVKLKILYLVLDEDTKVKMVLKLTALEERSKFYLKNTLELDFLGNEVSALDIFGNELLETLTIWEIYNFNKDANPTPNHFYCNQKITGKTESFRSAVAFARTLINKEMQFVLISSDAGMGKSTALRQIALTLQKELQNNWIVHINLYDVQNELLSAKDKMTSKKTAVEFVRNLVLADRKSDDVLTKVFKLKFQEKKMIFLFDSLDEVCPYHRETVEKFIALLRETQLLIVLSTRPHEGKHFQTADIFELERLNKRERRKFIIEKFKMLKIKPPSDPDKWLDKICDCEDFWSLPLHLNMATSIYDAAADFAEPSGSRRGNNIYEEFLTKTFENTLKYKFDLEKNEHQAASFQIYKNIADMFNELFENLAVCLIFHGGEIKNMKSGELKEKIKTNGESINRFDIAKLVNNYGLVSFLHRSYAEYMVAQVFLKYHKKDRCQTFKLNYKQLKNIYLEKGFYIIREHICRILAASPSEKIDFIPFFIKLNKRKLLEVMIQEDCYELYLQVKNYITFSFKYSIFGFTYFNPLYLAMQKARPEFVQQLIKDGAKFEDILNEDGVLHVAIKKGLHQEVKDYFERLKVNIDVMYHHKLPLQFAAEFAGRDMVEFLIENGAALNENTETKINAFNFATKANNGEVVELLIAKGVDCSHALMYAAKFERIELFNLIYQITPDECKVERVREAQLEASLHGNLDIFKHICGLPEANPLELNFEDTFLHVAAIRGYLHCMPFILEYMNQLVDVRRSDGQTALMRAILYNQEEVAEWLLEQHANINAVDNDGRSCLHHIATGGVYSTVFERVSLDTRAHGRDMVEITYHGTIFTPGQRVVKYLLENGANPEIPDKHGNTCLHVACESNSLEMVKLMIELLPLNCTNKKKLTPLHLAALRGSEEVVAYLLEEAKKQNLEPVDGEKVLSLTKRVQESKSRSNHLCKSEDKNLEIEILQWQYIVKDVCSSE